MPDDVSCLRIRPRSGPNPSSGSAGIWNANMYQDLRPCVLLVAALIIAGGVRRRQRRHRLEPIAVVARELPRDTAAPVMADNVETIDAGRIDHRDDVVAQLVERVGAAFLRSCASRVAALVGSEHAVTRLDEVGRHFLPRRTRLGEAVQQHDQLVRGRAGVGDVERQAVVGELFHYLFLGALMRSRMSSGTPNGKLRSNSNASSRV